LFDRNYADAPSLVSAGVSMDEDISYEEIVGDISRFYDKDGDLVKNALVYSDDYLAEPMAGSVLKFTGTEYATIKDNNTVDRYIYLQTKIKREFDDGTNGKVLYHEGDSLTGITDAKVYGVNKNGFLYVQEGTSATLSSIYIPKDEVHDIGIKVYHNGTDVVAEFYVDGILRDSFTTLYDLFTARQNIAITLNSVNSWVGEIHNYKLYEVTNNGNTLTEFVNYPLSETNGLIAHDISGNGNNGTVFIGGSPDGTQWLQDGNKDYHHNLKYGKNVLGRTINGKDHDVVSYTSGDMEWNIEGALLDSGVGSYVITQWKIGVTSEQAFILVKLSGNNLAVRLRNDADSESYIESVGEIFDGNYHTLKVTWNATTGVIEIWLDGIKDSATGTTGCKTKLKSTAVLPTCWGLRNSDDSYLSINDSYIKSCNMKIGGTTVLDLFASDFEQEIAIPADPSNAGFDVYGNPISNQDEVDKYNEISSSLNRE
jgi:hypothetical protein